LVEILLAVSIVINILFVWYIVQLLKRLLNISDNMEEFFVSLEGYREHVETVYNLERFYGDSTLERLLTHSKEFNEDIDALKSLYDLQFQEENENEDWEDNDD
tara:strand:+ start:5931 stop:6239 length:309 start_codon:yes stop_codon:yes gene_type:complete